MDELLKRLKDLSGMLEGDPKLWMEIESVFRSVLSDERIDMSSFRNLTETLRSMLGSAADVFRLIGIDPKKFSDFVSRALDEGESVKMGLELVRHVRHVYGLAYRRAEIMARYGPIAWFSTSVSIGKGGDVIMEIIRADGESFTVHLRDEDMLKKFLESIGKALRVRGVDID